MALITMDPGNKDMKAIMGKVLGVGILGVALFYLYKYQNELVNFMDNTLHIIFVGVAITAVLIFLMSGGARAIKYLMYGLAQLSLGWVIEMNPFNILEYRLEQADNDIKAAAQDKKKLTAKEEEIAEKIRIADDALKVANQSIKILEQKRNTKGLTENEQDNLELAYTTVTSNADYIEGIKPVYNNLLQLIDFAKRAERASKLNLQKARQDLKLKRDLYETVTTSSNMISKAWRSISGDDKTNADAEKAIEYLRKDISGKIANIKEGIKATSTFMDQKDLENSAKLQTAVTKLQGLDLEGGETYSEAITSGATKLELGNLTGGVNAYTQFLNVQKEPIKIERKSGEDNS